MARPPHTNPGSEGHEQPRRESAHGTPTWVKIFGIVVIVLVLLFVVLQIVGGGHGPRRHLSSAVQQGNPGSTGRLAAVQ